jgi:hypothetical protein
VEHRRGELKLGRAYRKCQVFDLHMQNESHHHNRTFLYIKTLQHQITPTTQSCRPIRDAARNLHLLHHHRKQNQTRQQWA